MSRITLSDDEYKFLSRALRETDHDAIVSRCEAVVSDTQSYHDYKTIRNLNWLSPQVNRHMAYKSLRDKFQDPYPPYMVELGCCFGTDVRQLLLDGLPSENVLATDVEEGYWKLGLNLYQDQQTLRCKTAFCNSTEAGPLDQFGEKYDAAYALFVLHVFKQDDGIKFIKRAYDLLAPDGVFFGTTVGRRSGDGEWIVGEHKRWIYSHLGLVKALRDTGFVSIEVKEMVPRERMKRVDDTDQDICTWEFLARKVNPEWATC